MIVNYLISLLWIGLLLFGFLIFCCCKKDALSRLGAFFTLANAFTTFLIWLISVYHQQAKLLLNNASYYYVVCLINVYLGLLFLIKYWQQRLKTPH